jgi:hypothetical protein
MQAMSGAGSLQRVSTHSLLRPGLCTKPSLRVTLPSSFGRQRCRVACQASKGAGKGDSWEQAVSQPDTFTQYSGYIAEAAVEEADQLDEYNAEKFAAIFKRRPFLLARRLVQIAGTLGWWAAVRYGDTLFGKKDQNFKVWLRSCNSQLALIDFQCLKCLKQLPHEKSVSMLHRKCNMMLGCFVQTRAGQLRSALVQLGPVRCNHTLFFFLYFFFW